MTKINYLRKCMNEKYNEGEFEAAAEIGETLLREHWNNKTLWTTGYSNDLFNLACVHDELDNLERAAELYSDSARQISVAEGEGLPFADRINNLAMVFIRLGIAEPAFFMLGNVASIRRRELGTFDPLYADSLYNLANAAAEIGRRNDSQKYHFEALKIRKKLGNTEDTINSLYSLAFLYESASEYEKAVSYAETAMRRSTGDDLAYAGACNYLAGLYEKCKNFDAALPLYDEVLEIASDKAGREHSAYLNITLRRANLLTMMNRPHEALANYEEIRNTFMRVSGTKHIFYANCLHGMAMLNKTLGDPARAEELILEAMKIRRNMHEDITLDIIFLINLHIQENNTDKALDALVYGLMRADSKEFSELLDSLVNIFQNTKKPVTSEFIEAVEDLDNREKLRPILNKWRVWEKN